MPCGPTDHPPARHCAILAGGAGRRLGGDKAAVELAGRPLARYVVDAARAAELEPLLVAKPETALTGIDAAVLREPAESQHPLNGLAAALEHLGEPIVCCPCDLPLVPPELLRGLASISTGQTVVVAAGRVHPLLGRFSPSAAEALARAALTGEPVTATAAAVGASELEFADLAPGVDPAVALANVNTLADISRLERYLAGGTG